MLFPRKQRSSISVLRLGEQKMAPAGAKVTDGGPSTEAALGNSESEKAK